MKIKVSEATGPVLDWLVAKCEGVAIKISPTGLLIYSDKSIPTGPQGRVYEPSKVWPQGGPIIDLERIKVDPRKGNWEATIWNESTTKNPAYGPTPLIAAMRCFVASKLGDEVDVPEELCNTP